MDQKQSKFSLLLTIRACCYYAESYFTVFNGEPSPCDSSLSQYVAHYSLKKDAPIKIPVWNEEPKQFYWIIKHHQTIWLTSTSLNILHAPREGSWGWVIELRA